MYTLPSHRGQHIGGDILALIEAQARAEGLNQLVLETGHVHDAAWRVYERGGFTRCGPVLDYPPSDYSIFYEKKRRSERARPSAVQARAVSTNGAAGSVARQRSRTSACCTGDRAPRRTSRPSRRRA